MQRENLNSSWRLTSIDYPEAGLIAFDVRGNDEGFKPLPARRSKIASPITSTSIRVRRKQSSASFGSHTTGSFSLNEVLSTIGTAVSSRKAAMSRW